MYVCAFMLSTDSQDYIQQARVLAFAPCQIRSCINITIMDDCYLDNVVEAFDIVLDKIADLSTYITLDPMQGSVRIYDFDDSKCVNICHS